MMGWDSWKKGFDAWENTTAKHLETVLRSPLVLGPGGVLLTAVMRSKAAVDGALDSWWSALGLPTRRDQERALHALNQMQSRLIDLEETLGEIRAQQQKSSQG
jgi:hypothetical protein